MNEETRVTISHSEERQLGEFYVWAVDIINHEVKAIHNTHVEDGTVTLLNDQIMEEIINQKIDVLTQSITDLEEYRYQLQALLAGKNKKGG